MNYHELRREVVHAAREMLERGLVHGTWGNVSCRIPDEPLMFITPSGMEYQTITPEDLVVVDWQGNIRSGGRKPSTESPLHAAIYNARPELGAIVHTHSPGATSFAAAGRAIPAITEEIAQVIGGSVEVAPYAACGTRELGESAVAYLGDRMAVLMANHGLVGVGKNIKEALLASIVAERTAQIAVMAATIGGYAELSPEEVSDLRYNYVNKYGQRGVVK